MADSSLHNCPTKPPNLIAATKTLRSKRWLERALLEPNLGWSFHLWWLSFLAPLEFGIIQYGVIRHHDGVELRVDMGTDVRAMFEAAVIFAGDYAGYGNLVVIKHEMMLTTHYAHLSSIGVGVGVRVKAGQKVGTVGQTGTATGPHLLINTLVLK